jgi:hypothetical protein
MLLAGLLVLLAAVVAYQLWGARAPVGAPTTASPAGAARTQAATYPTEVPDVHLESLQQQKPEPTEGGRNLFREKPPPPPPPPPPRATANLRAAPQVPTGPPPPPPINLKFIGLVEAGGRSVAVLSDGRDILYGREGEIVDGRYLIVKINVETIEVSYPDGTGRRVIRLTG